MKYLLDVNVLIGAIWRDQAAHKQAMAWLAGKEIVLCPLSELGFLRISTNSKVMGATMDRTRQLLEKFAAETKADRIPDDLPALNSHPRTSGQVTDHYLADLAEKHDLKLATLDAQLKHPSVELVR
jgi:predicted nucleic acid-binding protein